MLNNVSSFIELTSFKHAGETDCKGKFNEVYLDFFRDFKIWDVVIKKCISIYFSNNSLVEIVKYSYLQWGKEEEKKDLPEFFVNIILALVSVEKGTRLYKRVGE